jgi:hypothetical protein
MSNWPRSVGPQVTPEPLPAGGWNHYAEILIGLGNEMLGYARHWEALRDPERAISCHLAASSYALAAVQVQSLNQVPAPIPTQRPVEVSTP